MKWGQGSRAWIWAFLASIVASTTQGGEFEGRAPAFSLTDLSGRSQSLSAHQGKVVVLDFWATWCAPCRATIPELVKLQEKYGDGGLVVLGISVDDPQLVSDDAVKAFVEKHRMNYPVLRADGKIIEEYFKKEPPLVPAAFVVDRAGRLIAKVSGYRPGVIEEILVKILGPKAQR